MRDEVLGIRFGTVERKLLQNAATLSQESESAFVRRTAVGAAREQLDAQSVRSPELLQEAP